MAGTSQTALITNPTPRLINNVLYSLIVSNIVVEVLNNTVTNAVKIENANTEGP